MRSIALLSPLPTLGAVLLWLSACKIYDPLFCDKNTPCNDPARPFCDLRGEYPASDGVARTCIPSPFDAGADVLDGGGEESSDAPAADAAAACAWSRLARMANVNSPTANDNIGALSDDGLTIYFNRDAGDPEERGIFTATREDADQPFGAPARIDQLGKLPDLPFDPTVSSSGLELFFFMSIGSELLIYSASRPSPVGVFGESAPTGLHGTGPAISGSGLALYFLQTSKEPNALTVQRSVRPSVGEGWGPPLTMIPDEAFSSVDVSPDERKLLLVKHPFLHPPFPLFVSERASTDDDFGPLIPLNAEILAIGSSTYTRAKWNGSGTEMVVSLLVDGTMDMFYSTCQ